MTHQASAEVRGESWSVVLNQTPRSRPNERRIDRWCAGPGLSSTLGQRWSFSAHEFNGLVHV